MVLNVKQCTVDFATHLDHYAVYVGSVPMFWDSLTVPSSRVKQSKSVTACCPKT